MDILSYNIASKADKEEKHTRFGVLGEGVEGSFSTMDERIDSLEESIEGVNKQANKVIIQNAVNLMKAHAKLNTIAQAKKYNMYNMVFDDLLDLSGIDSTKSSGYSYDSTTGEIIAEKNCVIVTKEETTDVIPKKAILTVKTVEEVIDNNSNYNYPYINEIKFYQSLKDSFSGDYYISRDNGNTWEKIFPNQVFYFNDNISPLDNKIRLKIELSDGVKLLNYAITWS